MPSGKPAGRHILHAVDLDFADQTIIRGPAAGAEAKSEMKAEAPQPAAPEAKPDVPTQPETPVSPAGKAPTPETNPTDASAITEATPAPRVPAPAKPKSQPTAGNVPGPAPQISRAAARQRGIGCLLIGGVVFALLMMIVAMIRGGQGDQPTNQAPLPPGISALLGSGAEANPMNSASGAAVSTPTTPGSSLASGAKSSPLPGKSSSQTSAPTSLWTLIGGVLLLLGLGLGLTGAFFQVGAGGSRTAAARKIFVVGGIILLLGGASIAYGKYLAGKAPRYDSTIVTDPVNLIGSAPFPVTFSAPGLEATGRFFAWDFGDNEKGTGPRITHTFGKVGDFTVKLVVTDTQGQVASATRVVSIGNVLPTIVVKYSPETGSAPLAVSFDASGSRDPNGIVTGYEWDFGDESGTVTGEAVTHTFTETKIYPVRLRVSDNNGEFAEKIIQLPVGIEGRPVPQIETNPVELSSIPPFVVEFDAGGSTDDRGIVGFAWDFDDGSEIERGQVATHTFEKAGSYAVKLTVTDSDKLEASTGVTVVVRAEKSPPAAVISANPKAGVAPLAVHFDGGSSTDLDGAVLNFYWDFGDGETARGQVADHTFATAGKYPVKLTVTDNDGLRDESVEDFLVTNPDPQAPIVRVKTDPSPAAISLGGEIRFDASESFDPDGRIISYEWDFGDGRKRLGGAIATRQFDKVGIYKVTVTAHDDSGRSSKLVTQIAVNLPEPSARILAAPLDGSAPLRVSFDGGLSEGALETWRWDFGDGATSTEKSPEHVFIAPGIYTVRLRVADGSGVGDEAEVALRVR